MVACYALADIDDPELLLEAKSCLGNVFGDYGLICGDLNTTLNPKWDRYGYTQDSHQRSRAVINSWINTEELIDLTGVAPCPTFYCALCSRSLYWGSIPQQEAPP